MKINQILEASVTDQFLLERGDPVKMKQFIYRSLHGYITDNIQDQNYQLAFTLAMKHFPEHVYHGKMYRKMALAYDNYKMPEGRVELYNAIVNKQKHKVMQIVKDHPRDVYSFTTSKEYATRSPSNIRGFLVLEQTGIGLSLVSLLTELAKQLHPRNPFRDPAPSAKEVLATFQSTIRVYTMEEFVAGDGKFSDDSDDYE